MRPLSNVKQIGLGLLMYAPDYDERLPAQEPCHRDQTTPDWTYGVGWITDKITPYVKNAQLYQCASDDDCEVSYGFPRRPFGGCTNDATHSRKLGSYQAPATSLMMTEGVWVARTASP
ncbi:MAG: hypothetical protein COZ06_06295 [Armatimonadetes bacterium CG_4_10_14_3_um_filter_66_18]|nr:DUF1559 domain-containing protein [Armatimonadota bacterium]OIP04454.1 MAG: hypothetical protein AUJ96_12805 [Armatimonadetes bacterium CG2_30_66_41]PIU89950.1 MAG: hypothetical protein COS65_26715 [Armatimonadetes bacterium CG06_land_8_20_14_3_00_66_21]PIX39597.1 MAG: hypothetical protein COZ57_27960 [Armatimonadetes bacterium CG_4_8_14_3_um_filter_66_20]PIY51027.1 MAG: hypothetical protein COZ06_06295 [Armatimonadetes bacterium CG_4_10_14_3_um_filter_66_18]PIZ30090.1 MAG: hypothetical pro